MTFLAAIVGRPNVGKSTLFNRLVGRKLALVDDTPGVTRDRREGEATIGDLAFSVLDTAGLEDGDATSLQGRMRAQTEQAIRDADVILFMIDARAGVLPFDNEFANVVRESRKPVLLLANKAEGRFAEQAAYDAYALGLGEPISVSAEHGEGLADLYEALMPFADQPEDVSLEEEADAAADDNEDETDLTDRPLRIAVVGRPNAGKSTLINQIIGDERLLTGPEAGITRDSIAVDWTWRGRALKLFDTAGLRRKARVVEKLEKLSVSDALRAIRFSEVTVVVIDSQIPFEKQDLQLADLVEKEGRAAVIAVNKWDLVEHRQQAFADLREQSTRLLPQLKGVRLVPISGLHGDGIDKLLEACVDAHGVWNRRIVTARLNRWFENVVLRHPPPAIAGRRIKLRYITQIKSRPPHFVVFCSRPDALPKAYKRYIINSLREEFDLEGTPIRLSLKKGDNPYAPSKKRRSR
ncbi:MAG: ribosome biogenesis GTPase Der [Pseudomonadota bacterium]